MERELPSWVSNEKKYDRAVLELKRAGQVVTDETIKALYVKYGGLVLTKEVEAEMEARIEAAGFKKGNRRTSKK